MLRRLKESFASALRAANAEARVQVLVDGDRATLRDVETRDMRWSIDVREIESITAWVQTTNAIDYVTVRLSLADRDVELGDDTIGFGAFLRELEARFSADLLDPALALGQSAYSGAHAVLWAKDATARSTDVQ